MLLYCKQGKGKFLKRLAVLDVVWVATWNSRDYVDDQAMRFARRQLTVVLLLLEEVWFVLLVECGCTEQRVRTLIAFAIS